MARAQRRGDAAVPDVIKNLKPMLDGIQPITDAERAARIEKAQRLMHENKIDAIVCQGGSSLYYYTGVRGGPNTWVLPAKGEPASFEPGDALYRRIAQFLKAAHRRQSRHRRTHSVLRPRLSAQRITRC